MGKRLNLGSQSIPIERLRPGKNARVHFSEIVALSERIAESGRVVQLQVKPDGSIVAGERRYRACQVLNENARKTKQPLPWKSIPCEVVDFSDSDARDWNVNENLGRDNFRFIELARIMVGYRESGLNNADIAKKTGYVEETVSKYISILSNVHPEIIARLDAGEIIKTDTLIRLNGIRDREVQKLRLEQWLGNPVAESEVTPARERTPMLSRRKVMALVKVLQESEAEPETVQTVLYIAGLRQTLPHKWHLKLSRPRQPGPTESER